MGEKAESSGYKGEALSALKKAGCQVGDVIRVTSLFPAQKLATANTLWSSLKAATTSACA